MASKNANSRHIQTPSSPVPSSSSPPLQQSSTSKLPRFLQNKAAKDRSKSVTDPGPGAGGSSPTGSAGSGSPSPEPFSQQSQNAPKPKKTSKFLSINKKSSNANAEPTVPMPPQPHQQQQEASMEMDEPPVIVEPVPIPRPRTRSERPVANPEHSSVPTLYSSASSTSRIGDLPTRLSGWFTQTFSTSSTTDLSLPSVLAQQAQSPRKLGGGGGASALLTAAKHGKGHLDKAMRYLLDSDAVPDKCSDPIWLLGVQHPGYEPPPNPPPSQQQDQHHRKKSERRSSGSSPASFRSSTSSVASTAELSLAQSTSSHKSKNQQQDPSANWPPVFYADFTSRVWLTYRSHFPLPIKDVRLGDLAVEGWDAGGGTGGASAGGGGVVKRAWWGGEKTWSSDSGWGCMLRTGQSLLANALVHVHLGRDWRRPPYPIATADYATYVQILTWFLDTPSPEAPFSVHRMALAGKELGTDVGQWFGPSVAAGAIRTLTTAFPECGLSVAVAVDSTLYQNQVFAASHGETTSRSPRRQHGTTWGDRPVLLLLGIRLGIEGVNPIYYDTIKLLYTFPQSVGIAGGRPSSSYYFVGSQADNLFYLDPHNPRPAIPLRPPPKDGVYEGHIHEADHHHSDNVKHQEKEKDRSGKKKTREKDRDREKRSSTSPTPQHYRVPTSPSSTRTGSSNFSYHAPVSPSPLQQQYSSSSADSSTGVGRRRGHNDDEDSEEELEEGDSLVSGDGESGRLPPPAYQQALSSSSATATTLGARGAQGQTQAPPSPYRPQSHQQQQQQQQHVNTGRWRSASASQPTSPVQIAKSNSATGSSSHHSNYSSSVDHHHQQHQHYGLVPATPSDVESSNRTHAPSSAISGSGNDLDPIQLHYCTAYSAAELKTFHCERVRKMPLSGLDPSMLIGFLVRDEKDWRDFRRRVGELPRTIFSVQDEAPTWPSDSDDNMGLESISEPDDLDLDDDEEGVEVQGEDDEEGDEGENEQFFETRSRSASSASNAGQESSRRGSRQSEEVDTEEDPVGPMTPGPGSKFDIVSPPRRGKGKGDEEGDLAFRAEDGDGFGEDDEEEEESDIEDDWVDPSLPSPTPTGPPPPPATSSSQKPKKEQYAASSSSSPPSSSNLPPLAKGKGSFSATKSSASSSATTTKGSSSKKGKKQVPVPVPSVRLPAPPPREHYPFPVTAPPPDDNDDYSFASNSETSSSVGAPRYTRDGRTKNVSMKGGAQAQGQGQHQHQHRMHNARARDGGRTQSGGVKGILTDS